MTFRCPVCREPLTAVPGGLDCANGHHVDRAREGYVNLLPGGARHAAGDGADAVRARRALLDRGHYAPVVEAVAAAVAATSPRTLLDAGCGEGTYLDAAVAAVAATGAPGARGWGIDVSKPAVRLAARRHPAHAWAVASSLDLPFADGAADDGFDTVMSVFAPRAFAEFRRVLRPGGAIVLASPAPGHLDGVRALLGRDARATGARRHVEGDGVPPPLARHRVTYRLALTGADDVADLVAMTPWHGFAAGRDLPDRLDTTVDVWITTH